MKSEIYPRRGILFLLCAMAFAALFLGGCTDGSSSGGPFQVMIPVDDGNNNYSLQQRQLNTLTDIHSMGGTAAVFKSDGQFDVNINDDGSATVSSPTHGATPSAHFIVNGGVYHPSDFKSLSMTTAMYHFENIKQFYDAQGATKDIPFPREVLIDVKVDEHQDGQSQEAIDNASYVLGLDLFWINPYRDQYVPLTINGGVLAHEFLHNVFNYKLIAAQKRHPEIKPDQSKTTMSLAKFRLNEWKGEQNDYSDDYCEIQLPPLPNYSEFLPYGEAPQTPPTPKYSSDDFHGANSFLFSSVNEGLADFMGYEYTHNPHWIVASLPSETDREMDSEKTFSDTRDHQMQIFVKAANPHSHCDVLDPHAYGAYFSHVLYLAATEKDTQDHWDTETHDAAKKAAMDFMDAYADFLITSMKKQYWSMGDLVKLYFKNKIPSQATCTKLHSLFPAELDDRSLPCAKVSGP